MSTLTFPLSRQNKINPGPPSSTRPSRLVLTASPSAAPLTCQTKQTKQKKKTQREHRRAGGGQMDAFA